MNTRKTRNYNVQDYITEIYTQKTSNRRFLNILKAYYKKQDYAY